MEESHKRIIEIGGVKLEVDLREAKTIETYKVGDKVKLLKKSGYGAEQYQACPGIIISFDAFEKLPTICVAYLETDSYDAAIKMAYINSQTEEFELAHTDEDLVLGREDILRRMDKKIEAKKAEVVELETKKTYFENAFGAYFDGPRPSYKMESELEK